jgi:hypothetical protein
MQHSRVFIRASNPWYLKDLKLSAPAYNTSLALYFIAYVIFEVPANVSTS